MLDAEVGLEPSPDADAEAGLERALALAYRYLNSRERTQAEMRGHLERKGIDARDVERSIRVLVEQGYLDDARFAHLFVQDKRELEGWGADRIRQVLGTRGVDAEVVEEALAEHEQDSEGEVERALAVLRRRFPSPPRERRERDRALGVLLRKGYDPEHALDAIAAHARAADV
ncbi:MAG: regulatory protein RecX [Solirubrobacteraceae bacterium]